MIHLVHTNKRILLNIVNHIISYMFRLYLHLIIKMLCTSNYSNCTPSRIVVEPYIFVRYLGCWLPYYNNLGFQQFTKFYYYITIIRCKFIITSHFIGTLIFSAPACIIKPDINSAHLFLFSNGHSAMSSNFVNHIVSYMFRLYLHKQCLC